MLSYLCHTHIHYTQREELMRLWVADASDLHVQLLGTCNS